MTHLFIDSTYDITLGILDESLGWVDFQKFVGKKASNVLQTEAFNMLSIHKLKAENLSSIITVAGPGFYTGLRLSEGFADVMGFFQKPHYSFYSYEIPRWNQAEEGIWLTKAYRGEFFFHHWSKDESKNVLVAAKDLESYLAGFKHLPVFIHSESALDQMSAELVTRAVCTHEILRHSPLQIFKKVIENKMKVESYYFRAPEDEFRTSV